MKSPFAPGVRRLAVVAFCALALGGCPRGFEGPGRSDSASCETVADCNQGRICASEPLFACVDQRCESEPSLIRACADDDGGQSDASSDASSADASSADASSDAGS